MVGGEICRPDPVLLCRRDGEQLGQLHDFRSRTAAPNLRARMQNGALGLHKQLRRFLDWSRVGRDLTRDFETARREDLRLDIRLIEDVPRKTQEGGPAGWGRGQLKGLDGPLRYSGGFSDNPSPLRVL